MKIAKKDLWILLGVLLLGLVNGLLYVYLVPPWQHYDEPNHFEFSWLIASRGRLPRLEDYDQSMRREVALSMIAHGFFKKMDFLPNLEDESTPIWIGQFTQLSNPPIYYQTVAALLKGMISTTDVTRQLYTARLFSLFLYLVSLAAAWAVVAEITPPGHWLRLMLPMGIALLPAYTDLMTAMNSDVAAVALFSIFTWAGIRMVHKGIAVWPVVVALGLGILSFWIKETVYVSLPLFLVALLLSVSNGKNHWLGTALVGLALVGSLFALFTWGDAAWWARRTAQGGATRQLTSSAPLGGHALQLQFRPGAPRTDVQQIIQLIPPADALTFQGKEVTVGAWIWASQPVEGRPLTLTIDDGKQVFYEAINIGKSPVFHAFTVAPKGNTARAWLTLGMPTRPTHPVTVYYDGVVMAAGAYPLDQAPVFQDVDARAGTWGGQPFTNLVRNGSAERAWPEVRQWADALGTQYLPDHTRPSWIMAISLDWKAAGWYQQLTAVRLFRTFWAVFGWGNVALASGKPYRLLAVISAIGLIGAAIALVRRRRSINWSTVIFIGLVLLGIWGPSFVRGFNYIIFNPYFPVARYAFPGVIVTMLVLMVGWGEWVHLVKKKLSLPSWVTYGLGLAFFVLLNILALVTIVNYYRS